MKKIKKGRSLGLGPAFTVCLMGSDQKYIEEESRRTGTSKGAILRRLVRTALSGSGKRVSA